MSTNNLRELAAMYFTGSGYSIEEVCERCAKLDFNGCCNVDSPCVGTIGGPAFEEVGHCHTCRDWTCIDSINREEDARRELLRAYLKLHQRPYSR